MADEQNLDPQAFEANAAEAAGDDLVARVHALEEQLAAAQDQALRVSADMQNVRRRAEQDVEKAHKFALEKFANDLLPVVDSLERGLELTSAADEASKAIREGMELTLKLFLDTLKRYQLEAVDPDLAQLVEWHFFGGLSFVEIAAARGVNGRTVRRHWDMARALLLQAIDGAAG